MWKLWVLILNSLSRKHGDEKRNYDNVHWATKSMIQYEIRVFDVYFNKMNCDFCSVEHFLKTSLKWASNLEVYRKSIPFLGKNVNSEMYGNAASTMGIKKEGIAINIFRSRCFDTNFFPISLGGPPAPT